MQSDMPVIPGLKLHWKNSFMNSDDFRILMAGDSALIVEFGNEINEAVNCLVRTFTETVEAAAAGKKITGITECVPTFRSVSVYYNPLVISYGRLCGLLAGLVHTIAAEEKTRSSLSGTGTLHRVPVCYEDDFAPDMRNIMDHSGLTRDQVVAVHSGRDYRIYMLGFIPGFVYLGGMDERLNTPRLAVPRLKISAGSVAIGGAQTGIYPLESPGGWQIIGKTPIKPYDPERIPQILFQAGDSIRFVPVSSGEYRKIEKDQSERIRKSSSFFFHKKTVRIVASGIRIVSGGFLTTVQDNGRSGHQKEGFSVSGAMDMVSYRIANALAGNPPDSAVLETTLQGPELQFTLPAYFAVTGADCSPELDGTPVQMYQKTYAPGASVLKTGTVKSGIRSYIAFSGGVLVPEIMGSSSTSTRYRLGGYYGRKLETGDELPLGMPSGQKSVEPIRVPDILTPSGYDRNGTGRLNIRVLPGPQDDYFTEKGKRIFTSSVYVVNGQSDRMGYRFDGEKIESSAGSDIISDGIAAGSIQVSASGTPIVMMADRQTTGGYAKIATVIGADLPLLAQAVPGTEVCFSFVTYEQALSAGSNLENELRVIERLSSDAVGSVI
jgi:KipI family sensor histidine kinase inhibitor